MDNLDLCVADFFLCLLIFECVHLMNGNVGGVIHPEFGIIFNPVHPFKKEQQPAGP